MKNGRESGAYIKYVSIFQVRLSKDGSFDRREPDAVQ